MDDYRGGTIQNRAWTLYAAKDLKLEHFALRKPKADELQVDIRATGLCGSDLHYYNHFRNGDIIVKEQLVLGHESAGVVSDIGSSVLGFNIGDRVALEVGMPCEKCDICQQGRYNLCKEMRFRSSAKFFPYTQGTLQDKINHPAKWCHKLPHGFPYELGALLEPLSVGIHAIRRSSTVVGSKVLVFGAGAVGMLTSVLAMYYGARKVIIADIDQGRVQFALNHGFAHSGYVIPAKKGSNTDEELQIARSLATAIGETIKTSTGEADGEVDVVYECTGVQPCVQAGIYAVRPGGKLVLIGMGTPVQTLPLSAAALREVDIVGVFRYVNTYAEGIRLVAEMQSLTRQNGVGSTPAIEQLITHRFSGLEQAEEAFKLAGRTQDSNGNLVLKVMIEN